MTGQLPQPGGSLRPLLCLGRGLWKLGHMGESPLPAVDNPPADRGGSQGSNPQRGGQASLDLGDIPPLGSSGGTVMNPKKLGWLDSIMGTGLALLHASQPPTWEQKNQRWVCCLEPP